jgi:hypothetical protein
MIRNEAVDWAFRPHRMRRGLPIGSVLEGSRTELTEEWQLEGYKACDGQTKPEPGGMMIQRRGEKRDEIVAGPEAKKAKTD